MIIPMQQRRDTAANWTSKNSVLLDGEIGIEKDTGKAKVGNGSTAWNSLAYWNPGGSGGGSGTVTSVSVATANGFAGTVATPTTTPAVTVETTVTGLLKGNGTGVSAATAGTDYLAPTGSGAGLTGITAAQVGADASGAAATAQANAEAASIPITGGTATGPVIATSISASGITGTSAASRMVGAGTAYGPPLSGTFNQFDTYLDGSGNIWICTVAGTSGSWMQLVPRPASYFYPEQYGCKADMQLINDAAITSGQATLTTAGVVNPSVAPTLTPGTTGGLMAAGVYQSAYTYATAFGETTASPTASVTTTTATSTVTVTAPAIVPGGAIGFHVYMTAVGGSTLFRQTASGNPWPLQNNYIQSAVPSTSGANPPGSNTTASNPFPAMTAGMSIRVVGAGAAGADLLTTVLSVGANSATLAANAGTTVARGGAAVGTDNAANIQSCLNAMGTYMATHNARSTMVCADGIYGMATPPTVGGSFGGNCVVGLPTMPNGGAKGVPVIRGVSMDAGTLPLYQQMVPEASGSCFAYIGPNGTNNATFGPAHVFGTPTNPAVYVNESGTVPGTVNIKAVFDSIRVIVPWAGGIGGIDLFSAAECAVTNCDVRALATVPSGTGWATMAANGPTTNQWGWGLRMPGSGNNAVAYVRQFTTEGLCYGFGPSEHTTGGSGFSAYCVTAIEAYAGNSISMVHNAHLDDWGVEFCSNAVGGLDGLIRIDIDNLRTESTGKVVFDPSNRLQGRICVRDQGASGAYKSGWANGGTGVILVNLMTTPGPLSGPAAGDSGPPATTVTWHNYYYLNAWITVSLSGGTFTSLNLVSQSGTSVAQPNAAGASTYSFMAGSGTGYVPAYSAGTLTHTVTLLPT